MDITSIVGSVMTAVVGIGTVSTFLVKTLPQVVKYVVLAKDAVNLLDDVVEALQDGSLTPDEIQRIKIAVDQFKADLKK